MAGKDQIQEIAERVRTEAPLTRGRLAALAGISYDSLLAWGTGARSPFRESLEQLAGGLEEHAARLQALAREVRDVAKQAPPQPQGGA